MFQGGALIRQARRDLEANRFDLTTGLLLPDGVTSSQSSSVLSGTDPKPSRTSLPQLRQPSPQPLQAVQPQQQNHLPSQQQHRPQPEEGLAGEIDRELAAVMDKSHLMVCIQLYCATSVVGSSVLEFFSFYHNFFLRRIEFLHKNRNGKKLCTLWKCSICTLASAVQDSIIWSFEILCCTYSAVTNHPIMDTF